VHWYRKTTSIGMARDNVESDMPDFDRPFADKQDKKARTCFLTKTGSSFHTIAEHPMIESNVANPSPKRDHLETRIIKPASTL